MIDNPMGRLNDAKIKTMLRNNHIQQRAIEARDYQNFLRQRMSQVAQAKQAQAQASSDFTASAAANTGGGI